jgi:hypothetical protein
MGFPEIRAYLAHLAIQKNTAASTQNVALSALLFLYKYVLFIIVLPLTHLKMGATFVLLRIARAQRC